MSSSIDYSVDFLSFLVPMLGKGFVYMQLVFLTLLATVCGKPHYFPSFNTRSNGFSAYYGYITDFFKKIILGEGSKAGF